MIVMRQRVTGKLLMALASRCQAVSSLVEKNCKFAHQSSLLKGAGRSGACIKIFPYLYLLVCLLSLFTRRLLFIPALSQAGLEYITA